MASSSNVSIEESDGDTTHSSIHPNQNGFSSSEPGEQELAIDRFGFIGSKGSNFGVAIPVDILRQRELKWLEMLENWDLFMTKKYKKVRERCRKGIPPALRARAWQYLSGAKFLLNHYRHKFTELDGSEGDPRCVEDIKKDLHRQFPSHEIFVNSQGHGQADLYRILKAYSLFNPLVGYCQAQAPIAAALLMHMPAEHAFWCLVAICDKYLPGYYSPGLEAIQIDGDILFGLLKKVAPSIHKHLKKQRIEPILYMTEWFMCAFSRTLPWSTVLRVWDMFLCEGIKVLFKVALVILRSVFSKSETLKNCPSMYETLECLRHIPPEYLQEDYLIDQVLKLNISEHDMEKEHQKQVAKRRALKEQQMVQDRINGVKKKVN
ncbi:TBC1 domain family member 10A [Parasteatoda tepidariorum]|uniref:TBC1 domain family member 10A n=1 Tax=Parasteatoda tepidariorum TaxID=114398 RepID=UPI000A2C09E3|nr:TBC1 domain family member 10A [Parasteatoda tepidariorum]XP_042904369.1 TBC1 domain family member 10A [Parasteatoda tepidariorum]